MTEKQTAPALIVGVGNRLRRDDGAGPAVADALRARLDALIEAGCVEVVEEWGEGARLIELMRGRNAVLIADMASTDSPPGTLHEFDACDGVIPSDLLCYSTHRFGVAEAAEVARNLGLLPGTLMVYAIEGADIGHGEGLTAEVETAVATTARRMAHHIASLVLLGVLAV